LTIVANQLPAGTLSMTNPLRVTLIILNAFLAVTAIAGGIGLISGTNAPPTELLYHSPFRSYLVPGLALLVVVGGCASVVTIMLIRHHRYALPPTLATAAAIIIFEAVEVAAIGSPEGIARNLQLFYVAIGCAICVIALTARRQVREKRDYQSS
jgi:hypothetical protein